MEFKYSQLEVQPYFSPENLKRIPVKGRVIGRKFDSEKGVNIYHMDPWEFGHYGHSQWVAEHEIGSHVLDECPLGYRWDRWPKTTDELNNFPNARLAYIWAYSAVLGFKAHGFKSMPKDGSQEMEEWICRAKETYTKETISFNNK